MTPFIFASGGQPGGPSAVHSKFTTSPPADFQKWEIFTSTQDYIKQKNQRVEKANLKNKKNKNKEDEKLI